MKCPKCKTAEIMGKGFRASGICRACYGEDELRREAPVLMSVIDEILPPKKSSGKTVSREIVDSSVCQACGQKIRPKAKTRAEIQRAYRARQKS